MKQQLVYLAFILSATRFETMNAQPVGEQRRGFLGYLAHTRQFPASNALPSAAFEQGTGTFAAMNHQNSAIDGLVGQAANVFRSLYRRPQMPEQPGAPSLALAAQQADNAANAAEDDEDDEPTFTEVVAQVDKEAENMDPVTGFAHRFWGRVMAPRRTLEECPSKLHRFFNSYGAEVRRGPEKYPYVWRYMDALGMNTAGYRGDD